MLTKLEMYSKMYFAKIKNDKFFFKWRIITEKRTNFADNNEMIYLSVCVGGGGVCVYSIYKTCILLYHVKS
jgi:hypothetical protein